MERLTARDDKANSPYYPYCFRDDTCDGKGASDKCNSCNFNEKIINKLAEYEDAEEQGLLLRLPCKVGDVVYFTIYDYHDSAIIETIRIEENGVFYDWVQYEVGVDCTEVWDNGSFADGNIGKTVFLTRKEAEQALKQMGE